MLLHCFLTSKFDETFVVSLNIFSLWFTFSIWTFFFPLMWKFNNFTRFASVFSLYYPETLWTHSAVYSFILRISPYLSLNVVSVPQEFFSSLGTPIIHMLYFFCFSTKAVKFPLIASFLHSLPCVICSNVLSAALICQCLAYKCQVLTNRFWMTEVPAIWFWCFIFILKFCSIIIFFLVLTVSTLFCFLIPHFKQSTFS